jgi:hypothetical protein
MLTVMGRVGTRHSKNTRLELRNMSVGNRATKTGSHPGRLLVWRALLSLLAVFSAAIFQGPSAEGSESVRQQDNSEQNVNAESAYLEDTPKQLVKHVPELKGMHPAADQETLPTILKKTAERVDEFLDNVVNLVAQEEIKQERNGIRSAGKPAQDNYLILRHGEGAEAGFDEFRMDEEGNRMDASPRRGFLVTSGFALTCMQFSSAFQQASSFRYLGDQRIAKRDTYVVAFAQTSSETGLEVTMRGPGGSEAHTELQGIAWVDKENFHILRMRTDLLAPQPKVGLDAQTTKVNFSEVRLQDVATPLWLPQDVVVYLKLGAVLNRPFEVGFKNEHHYTNYRRYRVTTKIVGPE